MVDELCNQDNTLACSEPDELLFDRLPLPCLWLRADLSIKAVNWKFSKSFDIEPKSLIDTEFSQLIGSGSSPDLISRMLTLSNNDIIERYRTVIRYGDEIQLNTELRVSVLGESQGSRSYLVMANVINRVETKVIQEDIDFKLLYDSSPIMMHSIDLEGRLISVNNAWLEKMGYAREEVIGRRSKDFVSDESRKDVDYNRTIHGGGVNDKSFEFLTKSGNILNVLLTARAVFDDNGEVRYLLTVIKDVTREKKAQKALEVSEEKFRNLYNNTPVMMHQVDSELRLIDVNDYWLKKLGYNKNEVIGKKVTSFQSKESQQRLDENIHYFFKKRKIDDIPVQFISKSGDVLECLLTARGKWAEDGKLIESMSVVKDITELKRTERELVSNKQLLNGVVENSFTYIYIKSIDGKYLFVNDLFAKRVGKTRSEIIGTKAQDVIDPVAGQLMNLMDKRILKTGKPCREESGIIFNSEKRIYDTIKFPLFDKDGEIYAIAGISSDITESIIQRTKLEGSEKKFRDLYDKTPVMMHSLNENGEIIDVNNFWLQTLGYDKEEVIGKKSIDFLTDESKKFVTQVTFPLFMETGKLVDQPLQFHKKNGQVIDAMLTSTKEQDENGNVTLLAVIRDVTKQKKAEKALIESEQHFSTLAAISPVGIFRTDRDGKCIYVNKRWCELADLTKKEALGDGWVSCLHPDDKDRVFGEWNEAASNQGSFTSEYRFVHADGSYNWIFGQAAAEFDLEGNRCGFVGTVTDITALKEVEQRLSEVIKELEIKNAELVEKEELQQANTNLERANQELKEFAYMASHDLKAPLRGISNLTSWIRDDYRDKFDEDGKQNLQLLLGRVKWMEKIIEDILQYSKIGLNEMNVEEFDLNEIIEQCKTILHLPENCDVRIDKKLPKIQCVRSHWFQLFQNLIDNAIKHCDKEKIKINIGVNLDKNQYLFYVKDNGPGIHDKHKDRIFKIFQTLRSKNNSDRTGIGLAVVKKLVELNNGKIWFESEIGQGTTFYFTLPTGSSSPCQRI